MSTLAEIQRAVRQLSSSEKYEFSRWFLREVELHPLTEETIDVLALERFQALDAEEQVYAQRAARRDLAG